MHKEPTVISTFAGCGGSSLGYKLAGFQELLAIDWDKNAEETFRANFPETPFWNKNICETSVEEILEFTGLKAGELDVLDGSPPCQGFSMAGKRQISDSRNNLFKEYVRLIEGLKPKVFLMENVASMVFGKMKGKFNEIYETLNSLDYNFKVKVLNAANYGVPQSRRRAIFIGYRKDLEKEPSFPEPSNSVITVAQALKDLDISGDEVKRFNNKKWSFLSSRLKPGQTLSDIHPQKSFYNLVKLRWNKPANTVTKTFRSAQAGLLHPSEDRFLTISELKRIASFPDEFVFLGKFEDKWARIGNAVMPLMMKVIAENIRKDLNI